MAALRWGLIVWVSLAAWGFCRGAGDPKQEAKVSRTNETAQVPEAIAFTGKVHRVSLEGGFWGLVGDDGRKYQPLKLPAEFQRDGLRVVGKLREKRGARSFRMWGTIVEVAEIAELSDEGPRK